MRQIALALALALAPAAALAASLGVPLDQSIRIGLKGVAHDVIVGNPSIADVAVADQHHLVLTGKTGGVTNLIVTDPAGRTIFNSQIVVSSSSGDHVALINGPAVVTYACAPGCAMVGGASQAPGYSVSAPAPAAGATVTASPTTP